MINKMKIDNHLFRLLLTLLLGLLSMAGLHAQEGLKVNTIFEKYGKQEGATMVVLSGKSLHNYKLDKYKGITLTYDKKILDDLQQCIEQDKQQAREIKEVVSNGIITSGYYQLTTGNRSRHQYILFKLGDDGTATLIYMEGGPESEELVNRLFIKTD